MFKFIAAQLIETGCCRQIEIVKTFGVAKSKVIRAQNMLRKGGAEAFFKTPRRKKKGTVFTPEILERAQDLLNHGASRRDVSEDLGVKYDTLRKAINDGRLIESHQQSELPSSKSSRDKIDSAAAEVMGTACTRVIERTFAATGACESTQIRFEPCLDVPKGGVLCALPALLTNGLLNSAEELLGKVKGYYSILHILLLLAFMSLCRIKNVERLKRHAPGEFGKLLGLDRVPEVRCLRSKIDDMSTGDTAELWAAHLSKDWMEADPAAAGTLYIDGHVRVYHGGLTKPPRKYVSRERLCLRGTTDYWVNDAIGLPFFVVDKVVDPGMLNILRDNIVPRLLKDVPAQASDLELIHNPFLCRFVLVFDREGYSPAFFGEMWEKHRIACMTYHKFPGKPWPEEWFKKCEELMPQGEQVTMNLAEMGSLVGTGEKAVWMREVRKLTDSGHQTSIISMAYEMSHTKMAVHMFSRWCQENFFKYMMEHFAIDLLQEYGTEEFPATEKVVNPAWRENNKLKNSIKNKLRYRRARFASMTMHPESEDNRSKYIKWVNRKANLLEEIEQFEYQENELKEKLKNTPKHIFWENLEGEHKFQRLLPGRKRLTDTVKMIGYRAETAMAGLITGPKVDTSEARSILQNLFMTEADILPEPHNKLLRIRVHGASRPVANRIVAILLEKLNEMEVQYPGTDMKVYYEIGGFNQNISKKGVTESSQR